MQKKAGAAQTANAAKTATRVTSETKNVQTPTKDNIPFSSDAVNAAERTEQGAIRNKETAQSGGNSQSGSENIPGKMPELPSWKRGSSVWDIGTKGERKHSRAEEEYYAVWSKSVNADEAMPYGGDGSEASALRASSQ